MQSTRVLVLVLSIAFSSTGAFALHHRTVFEGHCKVRGTAQLLSFQLDENSNKSVGFAMGGLIPHIVYEVTANFSKRNDVFFEASFRIREIDRITGKAETIGSFSSLDDEEGSPLIGNKLFLQRETVSGGFIICLGSVIHRPKLQ